MSTMSQSQFQKQLLQQLGIVNWQPRSERIEQQDAAYPNASDSHTGSNSLSTQTPSKSDNSNSAKADSSSRLDALRDNLSTSSSCSTANRSGKSAESAPPQIAQAPGADESPNVALRNAEKTLKHQIIVVGKGRFFDDLVLALEAINMPFVYQDVTAEIDCIYTLAVTAETLPEGAAKQVYTVAQGSESHRAEQKKRIWQAIRDFV